MHQNEHLRGECSLTANVFFCNLVRASARSSRARRALVARSSRPLRALVALVRALVALFRALAARSPRARRALAARSPRFTRARRALVTLYVPGSVSKRLGVNSLVVHKAWNLNFTPCI
jgi:hypothetical protein